MAVGRAVACLVLIGDFMLWGTHGIIHLTWPVADHVVPWNQGGRTDLDNLVSSCASCNYGKDGNTIQQIGIQNPFNREPIIDTWNGLTDKLNLFSITH